MRLSATLAALLPALSSSGSLLINGTLLTTFLTHRHDLYGAASVAPVGPLILMDCFAFRCSENGSSYKLNELFRSEVTAFPPGWTPGRSQTLAGFSDPTGAYQQFPDPAKGDWCNMSKMIGPQLLEPNSWAFVTFTWFLLCVSTPGTEAALVDVSDAGFSGLLISSAFVLTNPLIEMHIVADYFSRQNKVPRLHVYVGRYHDLISPMIASALSPGMTLYVNATNDVNEITEFFERGLFYAWVYLLGALQSLVALLAILVLRHECRVRSLISINSLVLFLEGLCASVFRCWRAFSWPQACAPGNHSTWFVFFQMLFSPSGEVSMTTTAALLLAFLWFRVSHQTPERMTTRPQGGRKAAGEPKRAQHFTRCVEEARSCCGRAGLVLDAWAEPLILLLALCVFGITLFTSLQFPSVLWWGFLYHDELPLDEYRTESLIPPIIITSTVNAVSMLITLAAARRLTHQAKMSKKIGLTSLSDSVKAMLPWMTLAICGAWLNCAAYFVQLSNSFKEIANGPLFLTIHSLLGIGGLCTSLGTVGALAPAHIKRGILCLPPGPEGSQSKSAKSPFRISIVRLTRSRRPSVPTLEAGGSEGSSARNSFHMGSSARSSFHVERRPSQVSEVI